MFTVIGDPHAKPDNLDKIDILFDIIEELGNECIILGDLLDTKELVRGKCLNRYIGRIAESKLKFIILVGNHDWFNLECKDHSLQALRSLSNVLIVDEFKRFGNLVFLPYMHDSEVLKGWLSKCTKKDTVFCHADIKDFDYGNGMISTEGLDATDLSVPKRVISGHYHAYQERDNITYLGTPFSHSFGESNQTKYLGVYDPKEDSLELNESPFQRHITIELDCAKHSGHWFNDTDLFRVILKGTQEEIDQVKREDGVKYIEQPIDLAKAAVISEVDVPQVQFSKWAVDIKGYSQEIVDLGLEMLNDV